MTITQRLFIVTGILVLTTLACARTNSSATPVSPTPNLSTGETSHSLTHSGLERSYILYVPASVNWNQPVPLVFVFHGGTGNAKSAIIMSGFNEVADANGFLVVYPNGTGPLDDDKLLTWNAGACCGFAQRNNIDDVGFVRAIADEIQSMTNIDPNQIYATGMSNGGMLSQRLACEASDLFAAVAPVAGTLNASSCNPTEHISIIEFHGTDDQHVPYEGGKGPESLVDVSFASVKDSVEFWSSFDGCNSQPQTESVEDIQHETWTGCAGSTSVELYTIIGGGHSWPGGRGGWPGSDQPTQTISASELIWKFFAAHPK
ncbi:MAG: prolyl oligopeptidase family serine peptidase [Anaerolineales bacterium]|nr:prolyl oligopeptidase family serine peptidase [Anaerolineales bacterium]